MEQKLYMLKLLMPYMTEQNSSDFMACLNVDCIEQID